MSHFYIKVFPGYPWDNRRTEETTTGLNRLRAMEKKNLGFPMITVNDALYKHHDNRYGRPICLGRNYTFYKSDRCRKKCSRDGYGC